MKGMQWYIRYDFNPELIPANWSSEHLKYMESIGNVFQSKEKAVEMCNKIRSLFNAPPTS